MLINKKYFFLPVFLWMHNFCIAQETNYPQLIYDSITQVLLSVDKMDQYYRIQLDNFWGKQDTIAIRKTYEKMHVADSTNLVVVEDIIRKYGLVKKKLVRRQTERCLW